MKSFNSIGFELTREKGTSSEFFIAYPRNSLKDPILIFINSTRQDVELELKQRFLEDGGTYNLYNGYTTLKRGINSGENWLYPLDRGYL